MNLEILDEDGSMGRDVLRCLELRMYMRPTLGHSTHFVFRVKMKIFRTKQVSIWTITEWLSQLLTIVNLVAGKEMETVGKKIWKFCIYLSDADIL